MSERIRQTVIASLVGSKRIVVATCAAIAMVLGATSVGASLFVVDEPIISQPEISAIFTPKPGSKPIATTVKNSGFTQQHVLSANGITAPTATLFTPVIDSDMPTAKHKKVIAEVVIPTTATLFLSQSKLLNHIQTTTGESLPEATKPIESLLETAPIATPSPLDISGTTSGDTTLVEPTPTTPSDIQPQDPSNGSSSIAPTPSPEYPLP